jgi:hypothetical protein
MLEAMAAHDAPSPPDRADELIDILASSDWFLATMDRVATVDPPRWWVGAGVIRDLVWDTRFGNGFDPARLKDVDVAYFDGTDLTTDREVELGSELRELDPSIVWDVKNQAAVHQWYPARFDLDVQPFQSVSEAVATWRRTQHASPSATARMARSCSWLHTASTTSSTGSGGATRPGSRPRSTSADCSERIQRLDGRGCESPAEDRLLVPQLGPAPGWD